MAKGLYHAFKDGAVGFCPQIDPLFPTLNGLDHLVLFGRLRGVPAEHVANEAEDLMRRLGFGNDTLKQTDGQTHARTRARTRMQS